MKNKLLLPLLSLGLAAAPAGADSALTIYNQNFAVVRDTVPLDLKAGLNEVRFGDATAHVETDSVILRDPAGKRAFRILEQNYRNDPVNEPLLLSMFEGKTVDFVRERMKDNTLVREIIPGRIIRSGYVPGGGTEQPIIAVDGKLQFSLPGSPVFPNLGDDTILKPAFNWLINSDKAGKFDAEVGYVTGGFTWEASYNLVAPEKGDLVDVIGWITFNNQSGKTFRDAKIKLMAGDVNKVQPPAAFFSRAKRMEMLASAVADEPTVSEKSFDEFHLYTIARPTTLRDRESKQVEFVRATGVYAPVMYVYDGAYGMGYGFYGGLNNDRNYGTQCNKKVWVKREFVNAETNHLGIALPKGKLRFYRSNDDRQLEFTGEDTIDHTPRNETIRVTTGNSFDLVGERRQTDFKTDRADHWLDESFEIKLRNRKKEAVEFRVVEHLYRWNNWKITAKSDEFKKTDAQTIEFRVTVPPDQEKVVNYTVHYSW
ncbi:MAG: hypothetical protein U1F65_01830 [Verrucomicrobiota bacterium]